jgi:hypothetical protein
LFDQCGQLGVEVFDLGVQVMPAARQGAQRVPGALGGIGEIAAGTQLGTRLGEFGSCAARKLGFVA